MNGVWLKAEQTFFLRLNNSIGEYTKNVGFLPVSASHTVIQCDSD